MRRNQPGAAAVRSDKQHLHPGPDENRPGLETGLEHRPAVPFCEWEPGRPRKQDHYDPSALQSTEVNQLRYPISGPNWRTRKRCGRLFTNGGPPYRTRRQQNSAKEDTACRCRADPWEARPVSRSAPHWSIFFKLERYRERGKQEGDQKPTQISSAGRPGPPERRPGIGWRPSRLLEVRGRDVIGQEKGPTSSERDQTTPGRRRGRLAPGRLARAGTPSREDPLKTVRPES